MGPAYLCCCRIVSGRPLGVFGSSDAPMIAMLDGARKGRTVSISATVMTCHSQLQGLPASYIPRIPPRRQDPLPRGADAGDRCREHTSAGPCCQPVMRAV